jgi:hypothetical protein
LHCTGEDRRSAQAPHYARAYREAAKEAARPRRVAQGRAHRCRDRGCGVLGGDDGYGADGAPVPRWRRVLGQRCCIRRKTRLVKDIYNLDAAVVIVSDCVCVCVCLREGWALDGTEAGEADDVAGLKALAAQRAGGVVVTVLQPLQVRLDHTLCARAPTAGQGGGRAGGARASSRRRTRGWDDKMHFSHTLVLCSKQNRLVTTRHLHRPILPADRQTDRCAHGQAGKSSKQQRPLADAGSQSRRRV